MPCSSRLEQVGCPVLRHSCRAGRRPAQRREGVDRWSRFRRIPPPRLSSNGSHPQRVAARQAAAPGRDARPPRAKGATFRSDSRCQRRHRPGTNDATGRLASGSGFSRGHAAATRRRTRARKALNSITPAVPEPPAAPAPRRARSDGTSRHTPYRDRDSAAVLLKESRAVSVQSRKLREQRVAIRKCFGSLLTYR